MPEELLLDVALEHFLISIAAFATGIIPGYTLAFLFAKVKNRILRPNSLLSRLALFFPWRTLLMGILVFVQLPFFTIMWLGPGPELGYLGVSVYMFLFAFALAETRFASVDKPFDRARLLHLARSLAVFSVLLTYHFGVFGGGGLGWRVFTAMRTIDRQVALTAFFQAMLIGLIFDELFAIVEYIARERNPRQEASVRQAP